jgi:hypothetical protein
MVADLYTTSPAPYGHNLVAFPLEDDLTFELHERVQRVEHQPDPAIHDA